MKILMAVLLISLSSCMIKSKTGARCGATSDCLREDCKNTCLRKSFPNYDVVWINEPSMYSAAECYCKTANSSQLIDIFYSKEYE